MNKSFAQMHNEYLTPPEPQDEEQSYEDHWSEEDERRDQRKDDELFAHDSMYEAMIDKAIIQNK